MFIFVLTAIIPISTVSAQSFNNVEALEEYLYSHPSNSKDNPINITINTNDSMIEDIAEIIKSAHIYVNVDLSGSALKTIPDKLFYREFMLGDYHILTGIILPKNITAIGDGAFLLCDSLTSITIPDSVTSIGYMAFSLCDNLTSVTFQGSITKNNFGETFIGDLRVKYFAGGIGTYTRKNVERRAWTKQ